MNKLAANSPWTDEIINRFRRLWLQYRTSSVAEILNREFGTRFNRESIAKKAGRLGFPRKTGGNHNSLLPDSPARVLRPASMTTRDPSRIGLTLEEVQDRNGCRWPVSHGRPHRFCGDHIEIGSYCEEHHYRSVPMPMLAEAAE